MPKNYLRPLLSLFRKRAPLKTFPYHEFTVSVFPGRKEATYDFEVRRGKDIVLRFTDWGDYDEQKYGLAELIFLCHDVAVRLHEGASLDDWTLNEWMKAYLEDSYPTDKAHKA
jgi:hypothetical protein